MHLGVSSLRVSPRLAILVTSGIALGFGLVHPVFATTGSQPGPLVVSDSAPPNPFAIEGWTTVDRSIGVVGRGDLSLAGSVRGVLGYVTAPDSIGVEGYSSTTSGRGYGLFGHAVDGDGVFGLSGSSKYAAIYGENTSSGGTALYGRGSAMGVYGTSTSGSGVVGLTGTSPTTTSSFAGVFGQDTSSPAASGNETNAGVIGTSTVGFGVEGTSGVVGVFGMTPNGTGLFGVSSGGDGVYGQTDGTVDKTFGVYGYDGGQNAATPASTAGVFGYSASGSGTVGVSANGAGVEAVGVSGPGVLASSSNGDAVNATSTYGRGVYGTSQYYIGVAGFAGGTGDPLNLVPKSAYNDGVLAVSQGGQSTALEVDAPMGNPINVVGFNAAELMTLDGNGNLTLSGNLTQNGTPSSTVNDAQGTKRLVYSDQQTQATIEDFGEGEMVAGHAYVRLDPAFSDLLDRHSPYLVFVTPDGPTANPLYVEGKSLNGFAVREISNRATMAFDYRIVGRPQSSLDRPRLAMYRDPVPSPERRAALAREAAAHPAPRAPFADPASVAALRVPKPPNVRGATLRSLPQTLPVPAEQIPAR